MLRDVELGSYMLRQPGKVHPDDNLMVAIHEILVHKVSGLCVVDEEGRLVGILSELDCLRGILSATYNEAGIGDVREFMASEDLETAKPTDDIIDIATDMLKKKKRRRPVVDEEGILLGQISIRQILRAVKEFSTPHRRDEEG